MYYPPRQERYFPFPGFPGFPGFPEYPETPEYPANLENQVERLEQIARQNTRRLNILNRRLTRLEQRLGYTTYQDEF